MERSSSISRRPDTLPDTLVGHPGATDPAGDADMAGNPLALVQNFLRGGSHAHIDLTDDQMTR
jgi:hypothetical protein